MSNRIVRTTLKIGVVIAILLVAAVVVVGLALVGLGVLIKAPAKAGFNLISLFPLVVSLVIGYFMSRSNLWVEIAEGTIRERRLFTGKHVVRPLTQITRIIPLVSGIGGITGAGMD